MDWWKPQPWSVSTPHMFATGFRNNPNANPEVLSTLYQQPAQFAGVLGNNYGAYSGGLAQTGKSFADAFGAYNMGLGTMATARANERSNMYGANAMAEAARQGSLANIGTAALGAFGSASNGALAAWAANQQAYNNAASNMHTANQQAMGNLGVSRNQALGSLGGAYGGIGRAEVGADALSNLNFNASGNFGGGSGGGFSATGTGGPIASGSYGGGGGGGGGGFSMSGSRSSSSRSRGGGGAALGGLDSLARNVMDTDPADRIDAASAAGRRQLDEQHYSSRVMPSQMLGQTLSGLLTLGQPAYDASARGMDQFYGANQFDERPYESMRGDMNRGFATVGNQIGGVQRDLGTGYATANQQVNDMWNRSLGRTEVFSTPLEIAQRRREADLYNRRTSIMDALYEDEQRAADADQMADYYRRQSADPRLAWTATLARNQENNARQNRFNAERARRRMGALPRY